MKSPEIFEAKSGGEEKKNITSFHTETAQENFFKKHKEFLEHYAGDSSVKIKEAPPDLPTPFGGVDLENGAMYVKPSFFIEKGYSEDKGMFCALHEYEHIRELLEILSRKGGEKIWKAHQAEVKNKRRLHILDNCVDDIKMNRAIAKRAPSLGGTKDKLYEENLFPEDDMTKMPKHLQFAQAILRKKSLPNRKTITAPEVQAEIDRLEEIKNSAGVSVIDYATSPETPMDMRLELQKAYLQGPYEKFFEDDVREQKDKEESENKGDDGDDESDGGAENKDKTGKNKKEKGESGKKKRGERRKRNPEDYFKKEYEEWEKNNPKMVPMKDIEKAVENFLKSKKKEKTADEMMEEAYAKAEGVRVEELREYRTFWREIEDIENPETNEKTVEELREIFRKIIAERKKKVFASKLPVSEGEILAYPAEVVAQIKAGVSEPEVWQTLDKKEKPKELYGEFDVTVVCDRSSSMREGEKAPEQRKAAALLLEALKEFSDLIDEERIDLEYDLNVRTECWSFGSDEQVEMLKPLGKEMTERQRVHIYKTLADTPGSTKDFAALEKIFEGVSDEDWEKIKNGILRKIIIVLSDGESDDAARVGKILNKFRGNGAVVIGIGITKEGEKIEETYAPDGLVCEEASKLASTAGTLLEKYLAEINGKK